MTKSTSLALTPDTRTELVTEGQANTAALAALRAYEITDDASLAWAGETVQAIKARWKSLEEKRTAITKPINTALAEIRGLFAPVQKPLEEAEQILKSKIAAYTIAKAAEVEAAVPKVAAGDLPVAVLKPVEIPNGVTVRETWGFEVVDFESIPRDFLKVDEEKIKALRGSVDVPGIKWVKGGSVIVRTAGSR